MEWQVEEVPELRGYTVEWAEDGDFILSQRNRLYRSATALGPFEPLAVIDAPAWKALACNSRLVQRLLRFMVTNVVKLANGNLFVTFDKTVGIVSHGKFRELAGLVRPCRVLRSACAVDSDGEIYFGEYLANEKRDEVRIYRFRPGHDRLEVVHTFPPNNIRHVHGIYFDEFSDLLVCLTGDRGPECRMLRTADGFRSTETIGEGDESWRAVSALFSKYKIIYGTDAEFRSNHIYEVDRAVLTRRKIANVNGTVFYSKRLGEHLFFATTAENAPSQKENIASLWHVDSSRTCRELARFYKDGWNSTLFMFGTIHFPYANKFDDKLFLSVVGVKEDARTYAARLR